MGGALSSVVVTGNNANIATQLNTSLTANDIETGMSFSFAMTTVGEKIVIVYVYEP